VKKWCKRNSAYLPKYSFSCNNREAATATSTRPRGLNTDAYNGPLFRTHHAVTIFTNVVTAIP